jgi:hypothetical protein
MNNKRLVIKSNVLSIAAAMIIVCSFGLVSFGDGDKSGGGTEYDPSKAAVLTSFHPDSGRVAEKVIFNGNNFGADPSKVSVCFNRKKAKATGNAGNKYPQTINVIHKNKI